ncbi:hypothetical protein AAEX63_14060 [Luteococcus sp. H138]|uniref:hypothetical protein n=1 Tax=unclassified Luteococcus TaxID=2639923 RepID=UPI00313B9FA6
MTIGYRTVFSTPADSDLERNLPQAVSQWLRHKRLPSQDVSVGTHSLNDSTVLTVASHEPRGEGLRGLRYQLVENKPEGWTSTISAHFGISNNRIWIDIEPPNSNRPLAGDVKRDQFVGVPRIVRDLLAEFHALDGPLDIRDQPAFVTTADDVHKLLEGITSPERHIPVIVAGPLPGIEPESWRRMVDGITRNTVGMAATHVLTPETTTLFHENLPGSLTVPAGSLRTFLPDLKLEEGGNHRRHRIMSPHALVNLDEKILRRIVTNAVKEYAVSRPLPPSALRMDRLLDRAQDALLLQPAESITIAPVESTPTVPLVDTGTDLLLQIATTLGCSSNSREILEAIQRLVSVDAQRAALASTLQAMRDAQTLRETRLADRLSDQQHRIESQQDSIAELTKRQEDLQLEVAERADATRRLEAELSRLRHDALVNGQGELAYPSEPVVPEAPDQMESLLEWFTNQVWPHVVFTGDPKDTLSLEQHDALGSWSAAVADICATLEDYAQSVQVGEFSGNVHQFLQNPPPGRTTRSAASAGKHAAVESEWVNNNKQAKRERTLPVPPTIDPSGSTFMQAHFRIANYGMISPRLYYYDATSLDGNVYVGYIGRHLTNTKTS